MPAAASVDQLAQIIWDYMVLGQQPHPAGVIIALGSSDARVAECAANLCRNGYGEYLVCSGGFGRLTKGASSESEAERFAAIASAMGVLDSHILVESKSSNTGENILFSYELLKQRKLLPDSVLFVTKPYMERRVLAAAQQQWPEKSAALNVTSPQIRMQEYWTDSLPKKLVIEIMVGDLQRLREYGARGFQVPQEIPHEVWEAYEQLVGLGYGKYLLK